LRSPGAAAILAPRRAAAWPSEARTADAPRSAGDLVNAVVLRLLVDELAPRVAGRRIVEARSPAAECVEIALKGDPPISLGIVTMKALPLVFASSGRFPPSGGAPGDAPGRLNELRGAEILSFESEEGVPRAFLHVRRTHSAGRTFDRVLVLDLGQRPAAALLDPGLGSAATRGGLRAARRDADAGATPAPSLAWRRDAAGRLHVGVPPSDREWDESASFDAWNDVALYAARELLPILVAERRRGALRRALGRAIKRKSRALEKVRREMDESKRAAEYRQKAQLLLARKADIERGVTPVVVLDYDSVTEVEIDVDPLLPPTRNAEVLFGKARKADRKARRAPQRLGELEVELSELKDDLDLVEEASPETMSDLEKKVHPPRAQRRTRRKGERARFRTYEVAGGWKVLVGKSNRDNDVLTHRIARPDDLWFHARQAPGSHVVLRRAGRADDPSRQAILEAAGIAAFHSKVGKSSAVPVCYTERRHVRKPRGAKPGLAVVRNEKVVFVDPGLPSARDRSDDGAG
jgi:hypothetical protein